MSNSIEILFSWAASHGAKLENIKIQAEAGDKEINRCAVAKNSILTNQEICFIPSSILLSESVAMDSTVGKCVAQYVTGLEIVSPSKYPHAIEIICLAIFMVHQNRQPESFWKPYLNCLPRKYNLPVCARRVDIKLLFGGTALEFMALERVSWLEEVVAQVNIGASEYFQSPLTLDEILWAYASIISRAFPKSRRQATGDTSDMSLDPESNWITISEICLYPVLDLLNHKRNHKIEWIMSDIGVSFIAREGVGHGCEIFNNYGPKGNENLLGNYGFVLNPNPEDYVKIFLNTRTQDPLAKERKRLLSLKDLSQFQLLFGDDIELSEKLMIVTRIMVGNQWELRQLEHDSDFKSRKLESICLATLHSLLEAKLDLLLTNQKHVQECQDLELVRLALVYRDGQESILRASIKLVEDRTSSIVGLQSEIMDRGFFSLETLLSNNVSILQESSLEDPYDEFVLMAFALIDSYTSYPPLYAMFEAYNVETCTEMLGSGYEDFEDFYGIYNL